MEMGKVLFNLTLLGYSCGPGQALAVPGGVISLLVAAGLGIDQAICHKKAKKLENEIKPLSFKQQTKLENLQAREAKKAKGVATAIKCSCSFAVGGIPVCGAGMIRGFWNPKEE